MTKYLGTYYIDTCWDEDSKDWVPCFCNPKSEDILNYPDGDTFPMDMFMRSTGTWFDGYMTETNCSSIVCKFLKGNDSAKLYRIY